MEEISQKQPKTSRTIRRKTLLIAIAAVLLIGICIAAVVLFVMRNSPQRILSDSIVNSLSVEKSKFTINYTKAAGGSGLKSATLDGSYDKSNGYSANANAAFGQGDYQVSIKGRVALDRSSKAYYIYDNVDDGQIANAQYRMNADTQQAVQDNFKAKWTVTDVDTLGEGASCIVGLLQKAQKDSSLSRTIGEVVAFPGAVNVTTESSSGGATIFRVTVGSDNSDLFVSKLKETKQYTEVAGCDTGAATSIASSVKNTVMRVTIDTKQRQIKKIDVEMKENSGTSKISATIRPDDGAQVSIPKDAKSVQAVQ